MAARDDHTTTRCTERSPAGDRGTSVVEIMVAILLMGIVVSATLPALWVSVRASETSDETSEVLSALNDAANRVSRSGWTACPDTAAIGYESLVDAAGSVRSWPASALSVDTIEYWDADTATWTATNPFTAGGCTVDDTVLASQTLQRVTITATSPTREITRSIQVIVGDMSGQGVGDEL